MTFIRKIKTKSGTYLAEVKSYREDGKVKQKVIRYIGKDIKGKVVRTVPTDSIKIQSIKRSLDVLAVDKTADQIGIKKIKNKNILALVYAHLLCQRSIKKMAEWFEFTEIPEILRAKEFSTKSLYDALGEFDSESFDRIENDVAEFFARYDDCKKAAILDVTDTYFEGEHMKIKPRRGKDGKVRRLVQIGLAVTQQNGFPIMHKVYHGNLSNIQIFRDMVLNLEKVGMKSIVVDRGMMSQENLDSLLRIGIKIIAGLRRSKDLERFLSKIKRDDIFSIPNMVQLKNTTVYVKSFKYKKASLIAVYNPEIEITQKERDFEAGITNNKYAGYSLIYNNTQISDKDAVAKYYQKDTIERAFKQIKSVLGLRPIRVWLKDHVEGHIRICYLAYAVLSFMNYKLKKLGISAADALESLQHGYKVTLTENKTGHVWDLLVPQVPRQKEIMKKLVVYKK